MAVESDGHALGAAPRVRFHPAAVVPPLLAAAALVLVYAFFVCTARGQALDAQTFAVVVPLHAQALFSSSATRIGLVGVAGAGYAVALLVALLRRRREHVLASLALALLGSGLGSGLKVVLPRPQLGDFGYSWNSFPSGHAAATVALLLAMQWLIPSPTLGRIVAVPALIVAYLSGVAQLASYAHRLSDVLGGVLVVAVVAAAIRAMGLGPRAGRPYTGLVALVAIALTGIVGAVELRRWAAGGLADSHPGLLGVLCLICCAVLVAHGVGVLWRSRAA